MALPLGRIAVGLVFALAGAAAAQLPTGTRYAVLVGVNDYGPDSGLPTLLYAENDAKALNEVLRASGFREANITLLINSGRKPTKAAILDAIGRVRQQWTENDTFVVAFAGHGIQPGPTFFFCPADARPPDTETLVSLDGVLDGVFKELENCRGGRKLLLVDACRNHPPTGARSQVAHGLASVTRPALPTPPGSVAAFYACSSGEQAFEHDGLKNGVFFHHVVKGLEGGAADADGTITVPLLQHYVATRVEAYVREKFGNKVQRPDIHAKGQLWPLRVGVARPKEPVANDKKVGTLGVWVAAEPDTADARTLESLVTECQARRYALRYAADKPAWFQAEPGAYLGDDPRKLLNLEDVKGLVAVGLFRTASVPKWIEYRNALPTTRDEAANALVEKCCVRGKDVFIVRPRGNAGWVPDKATVKFAADKQRVAWAGAGDFGGFFDAVRDRRFDGRDQVGR